MTPNFFTTNTSSLYSLSYNVTSYYFVDITHWVWSKPETRLTNWNYSLPTFNLLSSYNIHVGKKFNTNPEFTPFSHWQNALFVISAEIINTDVAPALLVIDQQSKSVSVDLSKINSVWNVYVSMSAKMITYFRNSTDTGKYTTNIYMISLEFSNDNCVFVSSNTSYYLVVNQLTTFMLTFDDAEGDPTTATIITNDLIDFFIESTNNTNQFRMILQAKEVINHSTQLHFSYTDSYHKDANFWKTATIELYLFAVDPPLFIHDLQVVHANRWSNKYIDLPKIVDPNGLNWTVSLDPSTPAWIIANNTLLKLNTTDFSYNISETTIVSLKITNEKNAWTKYNLTIETSQYTSPSFGVISNITAAKGTQTKVKLDLQSGLDIQIVEWANNNVISWIQYDKQNSMLILCPINNYVQIQCAKLLSSDSCQNKVYSNEFTIFVIKSMNSPPTLANRFGPLQIYSKRTKLFVIPDDLFISPQHSSLKYSVQVLRWSVNTLLSANVTISKYDNSSILYLQSNDPKTCFITLCATDSNGQSAETEVEVDVLNWASKDCVEWTSQYQDGWIKCKANYILKSDGVWYLNSTYFSNSLENLFEIWGLIVLIWLTTNLIMIIFIGIKALYSIEFAHTLIIFVVSLSIQNKGLMRLITWIQIFKFDLEFIDYFNIRKLLFCKLGTNKMVDLQFYCQPTILNYLVLIIVILVSVWIVAILKYASLRLKYALKLYQLIINKITIEAIAWILIHIFWPFLWINLISDALNSSSTNKTISSILFINEAI